MSEGSDPSSEQVDALARKAADAGAALRHSPSFDPTTLSSFKQALEVMNGKAGRLSEAFREAANAAAEAARIQDVFRVPLDLESITIPPPPEHYIIEAQRDTIAAVDATGAVLTQLLEVQTKQTESIVRLERSAEKQTGLQRWVLGLAAAALVVSALGIATTILVPLLT